MNILITGAKGFVGSYLACFLVKTNPTARIICLDRKNEPLSQELCPKEPDELERMIEVTQDLTDLNGMLRLFDKYHFQVIFHLAAETHVDHSFENALDFTQSNIVGTHVLLECCRRSWHRPISKFIHMSTDEVYGGSEYVQYEDSPINPTNPYAATKVGAEALCKSYIKSFELPIIIVRCNNIYGIAQTCEKVIPAFITRRLADLPLLIQGDGSALRIFIHINDVILALNVIFRKGVNGEVYNIAGDTEISVIDLAHRIIALIPVDDLETISTPIVFVPDRKFQDVRYFINAEKLKELGWFPCFKFDRGLHECVTWYRDHRGQTE